MSPLSRSVPARRAAAAITAAVVSLALAATACNSSSTASTAATSSNGASPSSTATSSSTGSSTGGSASSGTKKVNANTASAAEIEAALTAAGVPNAARWTREVEEYRPYPADDPSLAKLKKNLQKYNPSADTLEKILSALEP